MSKWLLNKFVSSFTLNSLISKSTTYHFCDDVCGLPGGVDTVNLDPWAKADPVTQPIERNALRSGETCLVVGAPAFDDLLDHCIFVFENKQTCLMSGICACGGTKTIFPRG